MALTVDTLREQLATTELELENAKSHVYRCDGCVQLLKRRSGLRDVLRDAVSNLCLELGYVEVAHRVVAAVPYEAGKRAHRVLKLHHALGATARLAVLLALALRRSR